MAKFANMRVLVGSLALLICLTGCMSVSVPNYIKGDHPYSREFYGDYHKIVEVTKEVLERNGWDITQETHPSVYERASVEDKETAEDVLLFTEVKQHYRLLFSSYTHLNVFCHVTPDGADVEIRYGKLTPLWIKQFQRTRNDRLANRLLDQIEQGLQEL